MPFSFLPNVSLHSNSKMSKQSSAGKICKCMTARGNTQGVNKDTRSGLEAGAMLERHKASMAVCLQNANTVERSGVEQQRTALPPDPTHRPQPEGMTSSKHPLTHFCSVLSVSVGLPTQRKHLQCFKHFTYPTVKHHHRQLSYPTPKSTYTAVGGFFCVKSSTHVA